MLEVSLVLYMFLHIFVPEEYLHEYVKYVTYSEHVYVNGTYDCTVTKQVYVHASRLNKKNIPPPQQVRGMMNDER